MVTSSGAVVSHDRAALHREVEQLYGERAADAVLLASLPADERINVLRHRNAEITRRLDELER